MVATAAAIVREPKKQKHGGGHEMTADTYKALDMLNAFASVGVKSFDVTFTDIEGNKPRQGGFLSNRHINGLQPTLGHMLQLAILRQQNIILRPRKSERAELIQLDDLNEEAARRVAPYSFMVLHTSPGNYQAWVANRRAGSTCGGFCASIAQGRRSRPERQRRHPHQRQPELQNQVRPELSNG